MPLDPRAAESLLAFWTDAGVDALYEGSPRDRMAAPLRAPTLRKTSPVVLHTLPPQQARLVRETAWAAQDLKALAAAISAFEGCALKRQGARQAVCWRGEPCAPVVVIGEAPGADEDAQGAPFVGRAGKLLDRMLEAGGLTGRVLITNTVFWRPPGNRTPTPEEQLACRPFLERVIDIVRPRLLLLVGGAAAASMLERKEGVLALRGRWFEWRGRYAGLEIPALPTMHPAFLLRQPMAKKKAWQDLLTLVERLDRTPRSV